MKTKIPLSISMMLTLVIYVGAGLAFSQSSNAYISLEAASPLSPSLQPLWRRLEFHTLPQSRVGFSFVSNPVNQLALMFGGLNSTLGELNDLWLTDGKDWLQFLTLHSPPARSSASMAYDEIHQAAVLFGGADNPTLYGDTWLFNGVDWIEQSPLTHPSPRANSSIAYDAERGITLLFGGQADTGGMEWETLNETWAWDGEHWQQLFPDVLPLPRWGAGMVYDRARKAILLFGGGSGGGFLEDTWLWDGAAWTEQHPLHHPAGRADFGMAYDENWQQVILFGGQTGANNDPVETWAWNGQDWTQLPTHQEPPEELAYGAQLAYLPALQTVMLFNAFGEKTDEPGISRSEAWLLSYWNMISLPIVIK